MSFNVSKADWASCLHVSLCPVVLLKAEFDHVHIHLDRGLVSWDFVAKMAAQSPVVCGYKEDEIKF